jgi:hypothetical protein
MEKDAAKTALASTSTAGAPSTVPKSPSATSRPSLAKKKGQLRGRLFNGIDLTGFDTYLGLPYSGASSTPYGLNNDPEGVFTVQEAELHIGWSMAGITCVIGETAAGGLFLSDGMPKPITLHAEAERLVFKKGPPAIVYRPGRPTITVHSGYLYGLGWHPPAAAKAPAGKVPKDLVHPPGEWNRLECICEGDRITVILNGTTVNVATKVSQAKGKLFFESQGAEIFFRTINVRPLAPAGAVSTPAKPARP